MARDGAGNYILPSGNPVVTGTAISSTTHNNTNSDIATALTNSLAKNGETVPTGNLPMGGFRHTNVGDSSSRSHYSTVNQTQDNEFNTATSVAGTNTITASLAPAITSYAAGMIVVLTPANNNTGATTLALNGLTALDVQKNNAAALVDGDLVAGIPAVLVLDSGGDDWILLNPMTLSGVGLTLSGNATIGGTLDVTGAVTLNSTLGVTGAATLTSLTVNGVSVNSTSILTSGTLADARVAASNVTQHQTALSIGASQLTGTLADARVVASNVTQHQASLGASASTVSTLVRRDASGDINVRLVRSEYAVDDSSTVAEIAYRVNNSSDNYVRNCSLTRLKRQLTLNYTIQSDPGGTPSGSPGDVFEYY